MKRSTRLEIFLATVSAILGLTCKSQTPPKAVDLFPPTGEAAGWARAGEARTFQAENLWEYIDGDAERYIQAGVVRTLTNDYKFEGRVDAVADIYIMKSIEGSTKLFGAESSEGSKPASVGDAARLFPSSLVFRKGQYLVRVVAYAETQGIEKPLLDLGRAIERRL